LRHPFQRGGLGRGASGLEKAGVAAVGGFRRRLSFIQYLQEFVSKKAARRASAMRLGRLGDRSALKFGCSANFASI